MPGFLNNAQTQDTFVAALTVTFVRPRPAFLLQVFNAAIMYQLGVGDAVGPTEIAWEDGEHFLAPSVAQFENAESEGFPSGRLFAGIRIRSATQATPARVTVA